ncbi:hypothetical protein HN954_05130 [bacterium]|jgi:hypothetical protein|nr:hypothetical protein [bacterium]MBT6832332.1 hypothetical protein [bacterium]MBT6996777.1 hypothetical protein [bacterium]MBT7772810.1 hypothetical protein [bacterium]
MKKWIFGIGLLITCPVLASGLPHANFSVSPHLGGAGSTFTIDATDSRNSAGNSGGIEMRCQVSPTSGWTQFSSRLTLDFSPKNIGSYTTKCQIRDRETQLISTTYRTYKVIDVFPRSAQISVEKTQAYVGQPIDFTLVISASASENINEVLARWDFDNDGNWDTGWSRQKFVSHVFDTATTTSPRAEIKFFDGEILEIEGIVPKKRTLLGLILPRSRWSKLKIVSTPVVPPIVDVRPGISGFTESTIFTFDASRSRVPALGWLEWSFDGQQWNRSPRSKIVTNKFDSPGIHKIRVRACFGYANPFCEQTELSVDLEPDPVDFSAEIFVQNLTNMSHFGNTNSSIVSAEVGDDLRFSATLRSTPVRSQKYQYRWAVLQLWNEESDVQFQKTERQFTRWKTAFSSQNHTHTIFDRTGDFLVTLEIRNEDSTVVTQTRRIRVQQNTIPVGTISHSPAQIYVGDRVRFFPKNLFENSENSWNSTTSRTLEVRFDLDGDGKWESDFRSSNSSEWIFSNPGEVTVRMQIRDAGKNVRTVQKTVEVFSIPAPQATVSISKKYPRVGESVIFDARASVGKNLKFYWSAPNKTSKTLQTVSPTNTNLYWQQRSNSRSGAPAAIRGARISRTFSAAGEHKMSLWVEDLRGEVSQIFFSVFVY